MLHQILNAVIFASVVNCIILILYPFVCRIENSIQKAGLVGFFGTLALIMVEHFIEFSSMSCEFPYLIHASGTIYFLLAPFLNLLVRSLLNEESNRKEIALEFVPAFVMFLIMFPVYFFPGIPNCVDVITYDQDWFFISWRHVLFLVLFISQIIIYGFYWVRKIKEYSKWIKSQNSFTEIEFLSWFKGAIYIVLFFSLGVGLTIAGRFISTEVVMFIDKVHVLALSLTPIIFIFIVFLSPKREFPEKDIYEQVPEFSLDSEIPKVLVEELNRVMELEKLYLKKDLKLEDLASSLGKSKNELSLILNKGAGVNFYDFVNSYRINHAKKMIQEGKHETYSLTGIALESGFNNYISFYRVFKRITNQSPSSYIK